MFFTELPLGVRASTTTFPRRNRLISGAADAVLVLRAGIRSGALHTAQAAVLQGRPLLAMPGEATNEAAFGCNGLIRSGHARLCLTPQDAWAAVGIVPGVSARPTKAGVPLELDSLSDNARIAYGVVGQVPLSLDDVLMACRLPSGSLISALCELELVGLVVQHPGRRYQRV
jgi:DNA processing protein